MGFRNPVKSVAGVDTGTSPTGPGVRLYQGTTVDGFPVGILEMRDGVNGDDHATLTSAAFLTPQYDVDGKLIGYTSVGRATVLDGGSANGVTAPRWALNVEAAAAGGYEAVARLTRAKRAVTSASIEHDTGRQALTPINGWQNDGAAGSPLLQVRKDSSGFVHCWGWVRNRSGVTIAAPSTIASLSGSALAPFRGKDNEGATCYATPGAVRVDYTASAQALQLTVGSIGNGGYLLVNLKWPSTDLAVT